MLTFPLTLDEFIERPIIGSAPIVPLKSMNYTRERGRQISRSQSGSTLWGGTVTISPQSNEDADYTLALAEALDSPGATFTMRDIRRLGPVRDPNGTLLGASVVTLDAVTGNRELTLGGLPANYPLSVGDFLSFPFLESHSFHRIVQVSGSVAEVRPFLEPGYVLGSVVSVVKAKMTAMVIPGTLQDPNHSHRESGTWGFDWMQVVR